jgi:DMSO reductase anchor subunit
VDSAGIASLAEAGDFLLGAPDPAMTRPTTTYRTSHLVRSEDDPPADDHHPVEPEHAHWPLIVMLVLTQLSAGGFVVELAAAAGGAAVSVGTFHHTALCLALGYVGLAASLLHLGRPLYAYRALIGLRHSWLSREALGFGVFATLATTKVALDLLGPEWLPVSPGLRTVLLGAVVISGLASLFSSVMVYHAVRREYWRARYTAVKFAGTGVVLGLATAMATIAIAVAGRPDGFNSVAPNLFWVFAIGLIAATAAKMGFEAWIVRGFAGSKLPTLRKTAALLHGPLWRQARLRQFLGLAGGIVLPAVTIASAAWGSPGVTATAAILALATSIGGEMAERYLFFTAVVRPTMPGGLLK